MKGVRRECMDRFLQDGYKDQIREWGEKMKKGHGGEILLNIDFLKM
jgi:hypothetical protein